MQKYDAPLSAAPASHRIEAGGLDIHYLRAGLGRPLVLLHGWPEFSGVWEPMMARLASEFDVIAPDLRGFGDTQKPDAGPSEAVSADLLAADLLALLDGLGLEGPVGLISHDVGASVAQSLGRSHPERLSGLFFFNCPYPGIGTRWGAPDHIREIWYHSFHCLPWAAAMVGSSREACRQYFSHFLRHWSADPRTFDDALERWVDNFMKPGNLQGGFNWYLSMRAGRLAIMKGEAPPVAPITVPTRVFWGDRDPVLKSAWMDRLPEYFLDLEASVAEGLGHFVHYEDPDRAAAEVRAFFRRVG